MNKPLKRFLQSLLYPWVQPEQADALPDPLDYDQMISLDAEDLAQGGIPAAYDRLLPMIKAFNSDPIAKVECLHEPDGSQCVVAGDRKYTVWSANAERFEGWVRGPIALFDIVNRNLAHTEVKFYAFYGGNDLSGMFLTEQQVTLARAALKKRADWPYLLVDEPPHYGHPNAA
jgi:hypothetical protein